MRLRRLNEASQWLLRMQDPKRTDEEISDWLRWIDSNPENFTEFDRLQGDWRDLDALKPDSSVPRSPMVKARTSLLREPLAFTEEEKSGEAAERKGGFFAGQYSTRHFMIRRHAGAFAVGVAAIALVIVVSHYLYPWSSVPATNQQVTATLMNRAATLPDGSKMILGMQSRVNMDFNGEWRRLDLSTGEAYFKVRRDKKRPFVVHAGDLSVTAIGTAFDVRREHDFITVTVEEGTVEVKATSSAIGERSEVARPVTWRAEAGYQLTYSARDRTALLASVNPATELSWRNGTLAYVREPLGSVVEGLNRYSSRKIVIADAELATLPFTGTAFAASLDDWVAGVEQVYPIKARHMANGDIILSRDN